MVERRAARIAGNPRARPSAWGDAEAVPEQLAFIHIIDQYMATITGKPDWRERHILFHNEPKFVRQFEYGLSLGVPFLVQRFGQYALIVPPYEGAPHVVGLGTLSESTEDDLSLSDHSVGSNEPVVPSGYDPLVSSTEEPPVPFVDQGSGTSSDDTELPHALDIIETHGLSLTAATDDQSIGIALSPGLYDLADVIDAFAAWCCVMKARISSGVTAVTRWARGA